MAQFVTLDSRKSKAHSAPSRESLLARWEAQSRRAETQALGAIPGAALGRSARRWAAPMANVEVGRVLEAAVADAVRSTPASTRYELIRMIGRHLPSHLGGLSGQQVTALLDDLADRALAPGGPCGTIRLTAPEMVPVPERYRRGDGLSLWRRHGADIYTTRGQLDVEARLIHAAAQDGAPLVAPDRAAAARVPLSGIGLTDDQVQAAYGIMTSGRCIDILVGPAGTGKTKIVAAAAGRRRRRARRVRPARPDPGRHRRADDHGRGLAVARRLPVRRGHLVAGCHQRPGRRAGPARQ